MERNTICQITWLERRVFRAMASQADACFSKTDQSSADRAAVEFLDTDCRLTAPEIARRCRVSRQHVQVTVNKLIGQGVVLIQNKRHNDLPDARDFHTGYEWRLSTGTQPDVPRNNNHDSSRRIVSQGQFLHCSCPRVSSFF